MFFPDPLAALGEMLRVSKPGGALSLAVWYRSEANPFSYVVTEIMSRHVETLAADPDAPGAFRFADLGKLASILTDADAVDVGERIIKFHIEAPISPIEFWAMRAQTSETLREKLTKLSQEENAQIAGEVQQAVREFFPNNQMRFPAQMIIVTGKKLS
jgi:SAM-dependent methyltransferase